MRRLSIFIFACLSSLSDAKLADRSRIVKARGGPYRDNGRPIEGPKYRNTRWSDARESVEDRKLYDFERGQKSFSEFAKALNIDISSGQVGSSEHEDGRHLGQLSGCCSTYKKKYSSDMCSLYGANCAYGGQGSHDDGDGDCSQNGLSFIGISFSVNTANGNPYSYQLCDQFPMENIIDRNYDYVMSMDEDGWLVGGGYKSFDYSGKMPYIDSSHTELLRIGSMDANAGGTSINTVYKAMSSVSFSPFSIYPNYVKGGGGHHSQDNNDDDTPSGDVTLIVSVVETYNDNNNYSDYETFLYNLFSAMENVGAGACMDDHDTDPHVSMARGVKFMSSYHSTQYQYAANLEVAIWQAMYPNGVVIGSPRYASFPPGKSGTKQYVGYGSLYFFFDRANITKAFSAQRSLTDTEKYYATLYSSSDVSKFYSGSYTVNTNGGSGNNQGDWEHNPYAWKATSAMHDMTDGWSLPPNCYQEGETFLGIPLSRSSSSKLQSSSTFQTQFDFDVLIDSNYTYVKSFGTNHGWLIGESVGNSLGSIVDKDTAHIPIFYTGTTNPNMGGISLSDLIKVVKNIKFGTLYIKPAFVFIDDNGHLKLQFEADASSSLGYLYDTLCKELGISWNYKSPKNNYGLYTNCAMHAAGDRASYGCGPDNSNSGGFCPQMTLAYSVRFRSQDYSAAYLNMVNTYVDYWREMYPTGVAVGTKNFCSSGGCLGLFLNRYDLFQVFKPDLGGSWVEYNGASMAPTVSPAPTYSGGCNEPLNYKLDKCWYKKNKLVRKRSMAWSSLGHVGQASVFLVAFMASTLGFSLFVARARKKRKKGESYLAFFLRDTFKLKKRKKRGRKESSRRKKSLLRKLTGLKDLEKSMLDDKSRRSRSSKSRSHSKSRSRGTSSRSKSRGESSSRNRSSSVRRQIV